MMTNTYFYLHGFASSPYSIKAQHLYHQFAARHLELQLPDLNQEDFPNLTLTRQIHQVSSLLPSSPVTIIGSSLGGLTAAWLGEKYPQVKKLVLLAPAFDFVPRWLDILGQEKIQQWQETGFMSVYHYGEKRSLPINYSFVRDTSKYKDQHLQRQIPTLILHGIKDETVSVECSRAYASQRPWVKLIELDSDHGLTDSLPRIWQEIAAFCF